MDCLVLCVNDLDGFYNKNELDCVEWYTKMKALWRGGVVELCSPNCALCSTLRKTFGQARLTARFSP